MSVITWLGCDLVSGAIIEELPDLAPAGELSQILGTSTTTGFGLPLASVGTHGGPPREWEAATQPGRTMIVAVLNGTPIWAGAVLRRAGGTQAVAEISCVSLEGYLERRYVNDHFWPEQDVASVIAAGVAADGNTTEGIDLVIDAPASGVLRTRTYKAADDTTVLSALQELMADDGGPEWTIRLSWSDATQTAVAKTLMIRPRIGVVSAEPTAVFQTGSVAAVLGSVGAGDARYTYVEDYSTGRGANHVVALSSGQGASRPQATARDEAALAGGAPRWEHRFAPGSNLTSLSGHATAALALMAQGTRTRTITARLDADPILGSDWQAGDDIGYDLTGHRHPDGVRGVARAIGWAADIRAGTVSPILLDPAEELG